MHHDKTSAHETNETELSSVKPDTTGADLCRRGALRKIGKYSLYTAPVMVSLLSGKRAYACVSDEGEMEDCENGRMMGRRRRR